MTDGTQRERQAPLEEQYRNDPSAAVITLAAEGKLSDGVGAAGHVRFEAMDEADAIAFIGRSYEDFIEGQVALGVDRADVETRSEVMRARILSGGRLHPHHHVGRLVAGATSIGHLWVAREDELPDWYVWDVAIDADHRGQGLGRAAMELAHDLARADGAPAIGLSVVATNEVAVGLYRSLGYIESGPAAGPLLRLRKVLDRAGPTSS